jgi:hypothetical protein
MRTRPAWLIRPRGLVSYDVANAAMHTLAEGRLYGIHLKANFQGKKIARSEFFKGRFRQTFSEGHLDIDVSTGGFGIRACLVRAVQNRLRDLTVQSRQADIETDAEEVTAFVRAKAHFGVEGWFRHSALEP